MKKSGQITLSEYSTMRAWLVITLFTFFITPLDLFSADRYWVGNSGNWNNTSNWSSTSGGSGGSSVPTTSDDVFFDTNSFSGGGQTVTLDVNGECADMDWTGATNSPSFTGTSAFTLTIAGTSFTLIDAMTYNVAGAHTFSSNSGLTLDLSATGHTFGTVTFSSTSTRTININGNGTHSFGRISVGANSTINFNGTGTLTIDGYFADAEVQSSFDGGIVMTDTLSTGYDNAFIVATGTINTFETVLVGEIDDGSRNHRYQGTNTFNGEVITANDYQNTDRVHFYNSIFNRKVTITQPDGRAQFRSNAVFNDTLILGDNSSVRCFDVDSFKSVVILGDDIFLYLSQNNNAADYSVFEDSVYIGPDVEFRSYRNATFNGPVNFSGNDNNGNIRRFNDGGGSTIFNDVVYFQDGAGSNGSNWVFERETDFNARVFIFDNTHLHFNDNNGNTLFNDVVTVGNSNDLDFERDVNFTDSLTVADNNTFLTQRTVDFNITFFNDENTINLQNNVDFNNNIVFGDTNTINFCENGGELDAFDNATFGRANDIIFYRRVDFSPAAPGDSVFFGTLTEVEFRNATLNSYFEDFILDNESRATFKNGTNRFDNIKINDFSTIELSASGTNTIVGTFTANETCTTPPIVRSGTGGQQAVLDFTGSAQTWSNVIIQDLAVTGSNLLTIDAAVNNGNVDTLDNTTPSPGPPSAGTTVWITNDRAGTDLYWIGSASSGAGINWTDASNWSTSSGGSSSICVPTPKDNVIFDANSFNASGEKVLIDASFVICNDLTWTGVTSGVILEGNTTNTIFMTGDLQFDANMTNDFTGTFEFNADDDTLRTLNTNGVDFEGPVNFNYVGGNWEITENTTVNGSVSVIEGNVDVTTNNYNLTIAGAGNDLSVRSSGFLNMRNGDLTIPDDLLLEDSARITINNSTVDVGDDLVAQGTSAFSQKAGTLTIGGLVDYDDNATFTLDTLTMTVSGTMSFSDDVVITLDSSNITSGNAFSLNNDAVGNLGGSDITINGGDFYVQDDAAGFMKNGEIRVDGDQIFFDDRGAFTDTGSFFFADNDFFLDDDAVFSSFGGDLEVQSDDLFMDDRAQLTWFNGNLTINGDDFYVDDNCVVSLDSCVVFVDNDFQVENNSVFTASDTCSFTVGDDFIMNNSAIFNANDMTMFIEDDLDFDAGCTFNEGTSTVHFVGTTNDASIIPRGENLYNVIVNKDDPTLDVRISNAAVIFRNDFRILSGDFFDSDEGNNGPHQITGNTTGTGVLVIAADGSLRLGDNNGGSDAPSTFPTGWPTGSITLDDSSTVHYRQRLAGQNQIISSTPSAYGNLFLNNSNGPNYVKQPDGAITIEGTLFIDDNVVLADSGFQVTGNANAGTEFEMDNGSFYYVGSATTATTLPSYTARDWDQRSTIDYHAGVAQTVLSITGGGNTDSYGHLSVSNASSSTALVAKTLAGAVQVRRQLNIYSDANLIDDGNQITGNTTGDDFTMESNTQITLGNTTTATLFPTGYTTGNISFNANSLVVYNSNLDQDISDNPNYANIQLSSSGSVVKSLTGNTDILGDLTIDAQNTLTTTASNYDIDIQGDWINNGTFSPNNGDVDFTGGQYSAISGSTNTDFSTLTINNSAADSSLGIFNRANVLTTLNLTDGIIMSRTGGELLIADNATSSAPSTASYVDGPVMKAGDDAFVFPLGDSGIVGQLGISNLTNSPTATDTFVARYFRAVHPEVFWDSIDYAGNNGGMHNTSVTEYWDLDRVFGNTQPFVNLYWSDNTTSYITDTADLVVAHYIGANTWVNEGGSASGALASGSVKTTGAINSFSVFTFGSVSESVNPLPITLLYFTAEVNGDVVDLKWSTLSEINNDYFEIQRSTDAVNYESIEEIDGAGNSQVRLEYSTTDPDPIRRGYSYYRLKQTDFDGNYSYSNVEVVFFGDEKGGLSIFPNPSDQGIISVVSNTLENQTADVQWIDPSGRLIRSEQVTFNSNGGLVLVTPEVEGVYILNIITRDSVFKEKVVVE